MRASGTGRSSAIAKLGGCTLLACVALALACGGSEPGAKPTGNAMGGGSSPAVEPPSAAPSGANQAPTIAKVELYPKSPVPGDRIHSSVTAADPDGDPVTLSYKWKVDGRVGNGNRPDLRVGKVAKGARITLIVTASDGQATSAPFKTTIKIGNQPPQVVGAEVEPKGAVTAGHDLGIRPRAIDPDGDPLTYDVTWQVNGRTIEVNDLTLPKQHFRRGNKIKFSLVASDGALESRPFHSQTIKVENAPPTIESFPKGIGADGALRYQIEASDPDGDRNLRYRLIKGPRGMEVDSVGGRVTWLPSLDQAGKHGIEIQVDDLRGGKWHQTFDLDIAFGAAPASPAR